MLGTSLLLWALAGAPPEVPSVGERAPRIALAIALGVAPWCLLFAVLTAFGFKLAS